MLCMPIGAIWAYRRLWKLIWLIVLSSIIFNERLIIYTSEFNFIRRQSFLLYKPYMRVIETYRTDCRLCWCWIMVDLHVLIINVSLFHLFHVLSDFLVSICLLVGFFLYFLSFLSHVVKVWFSLVFELKLGLSSLNLKNSLFETTLFELCAIMNKHMS